MNPELSMRLQELEHEGLGEPLDTSTFRGLTAVTVLIPVVMLLAGWWWL